MRKILFLGTHYLGDGVKLTAKDQNTIVEVANEKAEQLLDDFPAMFQPPESGKSAKVTAGDKQTDAKVTEVASPGKSSGKASGELVHHYTKSELNSLNVGDLVGICKERNITGYTAMRKKQMIKTILEDQTNE